MPRASQVASFKAVAGRYRKQAEQARDPDVRQAYVELSLGYEGLVASQEIIERAHASLGRLQAFGIDHAGAAARASLSGPALRPSRQRSDPRG